jgi:TM2 domain-containing membrane protein YozV
MGRRYDDDDDDDEGDDSDLDLDRRTRRGRRGRDTQHGDEESKRMLAGLMGIFLGGFGVHKFVLGYGGEGAILLSVTLVGLIVGIGGGFCCLFPFVLTILPIVSSTIGLIEGIIYLTKSDEEFVETYQLGRRGWF